MSNPNETPIQKDKEPLSEPEVVRKYAGLHADHLLYKQLWESADLDDEQFNKWRQVSKDLFSLTVETLPRIRSSEFQRISVTPSPIEEDFYVALPGGRIKIRLRIEEVEQVYPELREMLGLR